MNCNHGAVWIFKFDADGRVDKPSTVRIADMQGGGDLHFADNEEFGSSLASLGDLDGDGVVDLAVNQPGTGPRAGRDIDHLIGRLDNGTRTKRGRGEQPFDHRS